VEEHKKVAVEASDYGHFFDGVLPPLLLLLMTPGLPGRPERPSLDAGRNSLTACHMQESYIVVYKYIFRNKDAWLLYFWQGRCVR
jgi:hypothetical protein